MRGLLDVNVVIALLDADHTLHRRARSWFSEHAPDGWASCPITQNGCLRVMSHPSYPHPLPVRAVVERLRDATRTRYHEFWPDDVSVLDSNVARETRIHGARQLTDVYLLALSVRHRGAFVTFDESVPLSAVNGAEKRHLIVL